MDEILSMLNSVWGAHQYHITVWPWQPDEPYDVSHDSFRSGMQKFSLTELREFAGKVVHDKKTAKEKNPVLYRQF